MAPSLTDYIGVPAECFADTLQALASGNDIQHCLSNELAALDAGLLPLHRLMQHGNAPLPDSLQVLVHRIRQHHDRIRIHVSMMFQSIEAGCACDHDPTPLSPRMECCEIIIDIGGHDDMAHITLCD